MRHIGDWLDKNFAIVAFVLACIFIMCSLVGCGTPSLPARGAGLDGAMVWLCTVSILGIGLSIAAAIFLEAKKLALAGIGGFGAILATALFVQVSRPYLPFIVLGLVVFGVIAGIYFLRQQQRATNAAVAYGNDMEQAETSDDAKAVKKKHLDLQLESGTHGVIYRTLRRLKKSAKKAAGV